jgi:chromate reductase, NAD(P)H dehydrogenase (quinone)
MLSAVQEPAAVAAVTVVPLNVVSLPGSVRTGAFSSRLLDEIRQVWKPSAVLTDTCDLDALPFFNQDVEGEDDAPPRVRELRRGVADADALLIVTPEYNRSLPARVKNALDWCSRPHGACALTGKPVAVVTCSPAPSGGIVAYHHARQVLHAAGALPVGSKEFAVPNVFTCFDERGEFVENTVRDWLTELLTELSAAVTSGAR